MAKPVPVMPALVKVVQKSAAVVPGSVAVMQAFPAVVRDHLEVIGQRTSPNCRLMAGQVQLSRHHDQMQRIVETNTNREEPAVIKPFRKPFRTVFAQSLSHAVPPLAIRRNQGPEQRNEELTSLSCGQPNPQGRSRP